VSVPRPREAVLAPGTILPAEDTEGGGHKWHLTHDQPWRCVYVGLVPSTTGGTGMRRTWTRASAGSPGGGLRGRRSLHGRGQARRRRV